VKACPSRAHSKVASGSFEERVKLAVVFRVWVGGPESMMVWGGRSTVHSCRAGLWSGIPCEPIALTRNVWSPWARPV
jgi:hypothetical protein